MKKKKASIFPFKCRQYYIVVKCCLHIVAVSLMGMYDLRSFFICKNKNNNHSYPTHRINMRSKLVNTGVPHFLKVRIRALHFYERPALVQVFPNGRKSKEDFCFYENR